jgi:hypothetical protein
MVLFDPHRQWAPKGICRWEDRNLFFAPGGQPDRKPSARTQNRWDRAKEICSMCPALEECARDTLGEQYGVYGGLDEHQRFLIRMKLAKAVKGWPVERQLAWGKELHRMRERGMSWIAIQGQCGIPASPAEYLVKRWDEHSRAQRVGLSKVVDLELPEPVDSRLKRPFPDKPGRRHAWVRSNGLVSDAWYRGQTPDGAWINVAVNAGRGSSYKWISAEDVHIYRPQAVVILNYTARPDDEQQHDLTA